MRKNYTFLLLLGIILLGTFLRFYKLGNNSFVADEFLDINSSYAYSQTGQWENWDFNHKQINAANEFAARDERAWIYKWQVAELFKFLPPTEGVARSISALWGIVSILLIYLVAKDFTRKKAIGLLAAFLFAISIDALEFDRMLRMYAMFLPVYLALSWAVFQTLEREYTGNIKILETIWKKFSLNAVYLVLSALLFIVSLMVHLLTANIAIILAAYLLVQMIFQYKKKSGWLNKYSILLGIGLMGLLAGMIAIPGKLSVATKELGLTSHFTYIQKVLSDYQVPLLAIIFLALGIYYLARKAKLSKEAWWLGINFLGILTLAIFFWDRNSGNQYIFFAESFKIILIASGIYFSALFLKDNLKSYSPKAYLATIVLSLLLLPNFAYFFQSDNTYDQTSSSDNPNYRSIFNYFKKKRGANDVLITRNYRNYYYSGVGTQVFDFGGELTRDKIDLARLQDIMANNPSGWIIFSDNDEVFISKDARDFMDKNLEKVSNSQVRGKVSLYRWGAGM